MKRDQARRAYLRDRRNRQLLSKYICRGCGADYHSGRDAAECCGKGAIRENKK